MRAWAVNGIPDAPISIFDSGVLYGDGVFETLRTYRGRLIDAEAHWARLTRHAARPELDYGLPSWEEVKQTTASLMQRYAESTDLRVRWLITRGEANLDSASTAGTWAITVEPLGPIPPALSIMTAPTATWFDAGADQPKSMAYQAAILARRHAQSCGFNEVARHDLQGQVRTGAHCNLFWVAGNVLHTPPTHGIVAGVVRQRVIELAAAMALGVCERAISREAFMTCEEIFATNSRIGICPVLRCDNQRLARGLHTDELRRRYQMFLEQG